jgi:hypothetical protein
MAYTDTNEDEQIVPFVQPDDHDELLSMMGLAPQQAAAQPDQERGTYTKPNTDVSADEADALGRIVRSPRIAAPSQGDMLTPMIKGDDSSLLTPQFAPRDEDNRDFSVVPTQQATPQAVQQTITPQIASPTQASSTPQPVTTPFDDKLKADQQKLATLQAKGSGVSNHHGFGGGLLKALDIAGSVLVPHVMGVIPGTTLNFRQNVNTAQNQVGQDVAGQNSSLEQQFKKAQIIKEQQPPQTKEGTPEAQTVDALTNQINPATGAKYTYPEAFQKMSQMKEGAKVKEGDEPLNNADNIGKALERSWQTGHPGQPLPDEYKLPPNATVKDLARIQGLLKDARDSEQNITGKKTLEEMHRQTMQIQAANAESRNQKKGVDEQAIETAAQSLAKGDLTNLKDIASLRGDQRLLIFNRAKELNPKFSTSDIQRQIKMEDNFTNGADGKALQSFDTFLQHGGEAHDIVQAMRNSQSTTPYLNKGLNWWKQNMSGDPMYTRLLAALEPVKTEAENFMLNGHAMHVEDKKSIDTILNADASPSQLQAAIKQLGHTVEARYNAMDNRYTSVRHQHLGDDKLSSEAKSGAARMGVNLGAVSSGQPSSTSTPPQGATHTVPGSDGKMHWTDGKSDLGVVQ